jgi:hypothetical protein
LPRSTPRGEIQPGVISTEHAAPQGISSRRVRFDRQGLAFDGTSYTLITVAHDPNWSRVGGSTGRLYLQLGSFAYDAIVYAWGTFSWLNNDATSTHITARACLVLYDYDGTNYNVVQRAENTFPDIDILDDNNPQQLSGFTQFILPANSGSDFWIGMQCQINGATTRSQQSHRDQQMMAFAVALDPDQPSNLVDDTGLGA